MYVGRVPMYWGVCRRGNAPPSPRLRSDLDGRPSCWGAKKQKVTRGTLYCAWWLNMTPHTRRPSTDMSVSSNWSA